jgi:hypothetical protein
MAATCALCGLRFSSKALLELHLREDHPRAREPGPERTGTTVAG